MAEVPTTEDNIGSPLPVVLGGRSLLLSPMNLDITGTIKRLAKEEIYKETRQRLDFLEEAGISTPENKKEVVFNLFGMLDDGTAFTKYLNGVEGTVEMVWLMLLIRHPDLDRSFVAKSISFADIREWHRKADAVTYPPRLDEPVTTDDDVNDVLRAELAKSKATAAEVKPADAGQVGEPPPNFQAPVMEPGPPKPQGRPLIIRPVSTS